MKAISAVVWTVIAVVSVVVFVLLSPLIAFCAIYDGILFSERSRRHG